MPIVIIDGQEVELEEGERLNGIQAARRVGADVPHYCWHPGLSVVASCRMCLVETGRKDPESGEISMMPKLVPACQTPATDGTVFVTDSEKVRGARAMVEEDLLIRHPIDCPICDKAGECYLQDYHFQHGREERRADLKPFTSRRRPLRDTVTLFVDRCVMCSRCVRFCREVTGTAELMISDRGAHEEIDVFPGYPLDNKLSGNVVDLCPVGALGDRDFLYQQRVWFMKKHDQVCDGCSTGCSIQVEENQDQIYRLKPRENQRVNGWWMCDEGRYGWKHVHDEGRCLAATVRDDAGARQTVETDGLVAALRAGFDGRRAAAVISPHQTVEAAYLLASWIRRQDPEAPLVLGPVPVVGEDESFPGGFTIRAEKCPNRRGVEEVIAHFTGRVDTLDTLLSDGSLSERAVWISGGYKTDWNDAATAESLSQAALLVVQDLFASPLWDAAGIQIPAAAFAEREGSYVNHADHLQQFTWAIRPPAGVPVEGRLLWQLLERPGMARISAVLSELAGEIGYFSSLVGGEIPDTGVDLRAHLLAESATEGTTQA